MSERVHVEYPEMDVEEGGAAGWFLAGTLVGAAIGLLFAPVPGKVARERLAEAVRELYDASCGCVERGRELVDDAAELFERGRKLASRDLD
jgi:gas vesicle protein